ncbi:type II toxin-antitoxin system RelE/ParE family toxin [Flavobacterium sp. RHBU_3]|uniref:type II toxin-antitoxin system RelE/ParE family toxin n=1 Tax=Flavobacterium sp. RHBU_3 TaxID=3391184 RepID=UPI003984FAD3
MPYKIQISVRAVADIREAENWYNEQLSGLGTRYKIAVKSQINDLRDDALLYPVKYDDVHYRKIKGFPYLLHYRIKQNVVDIIAVIHTSRNPDIWHEKDI